MVAKNPKRVDFETKKALFGVGSRFFFWFKGFLFWFKGFSGFFFGSRVLGFKGFGRRPKKIGKTEDKKGEEGEGREKRGEKKKEGERKERKRREREGRGRRKRKKKRRRKTSRKISRKRRNTQMSGAGWLQDLFKGKKKVDTKMTTPLLEDEPVDLLEGDVSDAPQLPPPQSQV